IYIQNNFDGISNENESVDDVLARAFPPGEQKIDVIEEAIKYIAHLQATLEDHGSSSMTTEEVQQQFREASSNIKSHIKFKERRIASFHAKLNTVGIKALKEIKCDKPERKQQPEYNLHKELNNVTHTQVHHSQNCVTAMKNEDKYNQTNVLCIAESGH
ncbi:Hypothetical predicted protein, partial [Paramuricea clavata]